MQKPSVSTSAISLWGSLPILALCVVLTGCERMPQFGFEVGEVSPTAVTTEGRGGYEWTYEHRGFAVRKPLGLNYMSSIDKTPFAELAAKHLAQAEAAMAHPWKSADDKRPEGLSEETYEILARYTEGHLPIEPKIELTVSGEISNQGFAIRADGKQLVTVGDSVRVWDIEDGSEALEVAVSKPLEARFAGSDGDIVVRTQRELLYVDGQSGKVVNEWRAPENIRRFDGDRAGKTWAVVLEDLSLSALGEGFKEINVLNPGVLASDEVAMHPSGNWIIANSEKGPIRWYLEGLVHEPVLLVAASYVPNETKCVSSESVDFWIGPTYCHTQSNGANNSSTELSDRLVFPQVKHALPCTWDQKNGWMLIVGRQPDQDNHWRVFLQDQSPHEGYFSLPLPIDGVPESFAASENGGVVAMASDEALVVFPRRRWVDPFGQFTLNNLAKLPADGKGDEFELCMSILRDLPAPRGNVTNSALESYGVFQAGQAWAQLESGQSGLPPDEVAEKIKEFKAWRREGSPISIAASIIRAKNVPGTYEQQQQLMLEYAEELNRLQQQDSIRRIALELKIEHMMLIEGAGQKELNSILQEYTQSFPEALAAHAWVAQNMQIRRIGDTADRFSYTSEISELYPSGAADVVYAKLFLEVLNTNRSVNELFGARQFRRGIQEMCRREALPPDRLYHIEIAYRSKEGDEVIDDARDYAVRVFGNLPGNAYWAHIPESVLAVRDASRKQADELAKQMVPAK